MAHYIPSMMALAPKTREAFKALPTEFTKKQFDEIREKLSSGRYPYVAPMTLQSARDYGFVQIVRTEKTTYRKEMTVFVNPQTKEQFTHDQLRDVWSRKLAREFGFPFNGGDVPGSWELYKFEEEAEVEAEGFRNIFSVNWEKFEKMCQGF